MNIHRQPVVNVGRLNSRDCFNNSKNEYYTDRVFTELVRVTSFFTAKKETHARMFSYDSISQENIVQTYEYNESASFAHVASRLMGIDSLLYYFGY